MFERFIGRYAAGHSWQANGREVPDFAPRDVDGYKAFMSAFAGATFGSGLYRVHDAESTTEAKSSIRGMFPALAERLHPFAYDWLGRHFALDTGRTLGGVPQVMMLEPGTGEALEIPVDFIRFHNEELVDFAEPALAVDFFSQWRADAVAAGLDRSECVGYRVPLFLGGTDSVDNLERCDMAVYWSLCTQLLAAARSAEPGTRVTGLHGE
jgi:hypothetical protein